MGRWWQVVALVLIPLAFVVLQVQKCIVASPRSLSGDLGCRSIPPTKVTEREWSDNPGFLSKIAEARKPVVFRRHLGRSAIPSTWSSDVWSWGGLEAAASAGDDFVDLVQSDASFFW